MKLDYVGGGNHKDPARGRQEGLRQRRRRSKEAEVGVTLPGAKERKQERQGTESPIEPPEGTQPHQHLDFSPVSDFGLLISGRASQ